MIKKFVALTALGIALPANAAQISLAPANVYASTVPYSDNYSADNVLDQQSGTIDEFAQDDSYWLNPDYGTTPGTFSIDLGSQYRLGSFDLFNTHNAFYNDRGTRDFRILASNDASFATFTVVASGSLFAEQQGTPLSAQTFFSSSNALFQYVQFQAFTTAAQTNGGAGCCGPTNYGLNEIRIFDAVANVPEPAAWTMMILGFGLVGGTLRGQRKQRAALSFS